MGLTSFNRRRKVEQNGRKEATETHTKRHEIKEEQTKKRSKTKEK